MSFLVKITITDNGNRPNDTEFTLYGNTDGFLTPITTNILKSELLTPYPVQVPDGTTILRLVDELNKCYVDITITEEDFCEVANFTFSSADSSLIGRIDVGDLLSNEDSLTDYRIFWYNENNEVLYTSGFGTEFQPYDFTHPLTGINSIFAQSGTYTPVIDKVRVDGVNYSQSGDTVDPVVKNMQDCLDDYTVLVDSFNCSNGDGYTLNGAYYEHRVQFQSLGGGAPPKVLESTFELSAGTNYFVWAFRGFSIADTLRLTFIGSEYNEPIGLEYITIGRNIININNSIPYSESTNDFFKSITTLSGLTINEGDKILMEVIPSDNPNTDWDFYFSCKDSISINECFLPQTNPEVKLIANATIFTLLNSCDNPRIYTYYKVCNGDSFGDFFNYTQSQVNSTSTTYDPNGNDLTSFVPNLFYRNTCRTTRNTPRFCDSTGNGYTIQNTYDDNSELVSIVMVFTNELDYNSFNSQITGQINNYNNPSTPSQNQGRYYQYLVIATPDLEPDELCGENTGALSFYIPFPNLVKIDNNNNGSGPWTITMESPILTRDVSIPCCDNLIDSIINNSDSFIKNNNRDLVYNLGQIITSGNIFRYGSTETSESLEYSFFGTQLFYNALNVITRPFTGQTTTANALQYSGTSVNNEILINDITTFGLPTIISKAYYMLRGKVTIDDIDNVFNFKIFRTHDIIDGNPVTLPSPELIYHYDGPDEVYDQQYIVFYDPNYVEI